MAQPREGLQKGPLFRHRPGDGRAVTAETTDARPAVDHRPRRRPVDRRFFHHPGMVLARTAEAAGVDQAIWSKVAPRYRRPARAGVIARRPSDPPPPVRLTLAPRSTDRARRGPEGSQPPATGDSAGGSPNHRFGVDRRPIVQGQAPAAYMGAASTTRRPKTTALAVARSVRLAPDLPPERRKRRARPARHR